MPTINNMHPAYSHRREVKSLGSLLLVRRRKPMVIYPPRCCHSAQERIERHESTQERTLDGAEVFPDCGRSLAVRSSFMILLAMLLASAAQAVPREADYSQSYGVWVSADGRACTYWLTDVGLNARQLGHSLRDGYDVKRAAEILTRNDTPARCIRKALRAIRRAGFTSVRVRLGTDKDRMHGIP